MNGETDTKYFRCNKCGNSVEEITFRKEAGILSERTMCTEPMAVRTSGICGGSISKEITMKQYRALLDKWDNDRIGKAFCEGYAAQYGKK